MREGDALRIRRTEFRWGILLVETDCRNPRTMAKPVVGAVCALGPYTDPYAFGSGGSKIRQKAPSLGITSDVRQQTRSFPSSYRDERISNKSMLRSGPFQSCLNAGIATPSPLMRVTLGYFHRWVTGCYVWPGTLSGPKKASPSSSNPSWARATNSCSITIFGLSHGFFSSLTILQDLSIR